MESLSTEDFIRSAKSSPEVKIDQSTVTGIEPSNDIRGTVIITFSVGKDKVQVRDLCNNVKLLTLQIFTAAIFLQISALLSNIFTHHI